MAVGIAAILACVQAKLLGAKIVLHSIFLRGRDATDPVRLRNERVNALIRPMADGVRVVWMDLRPLFDNPDGTVSPDMRCIFPTFIPERAKKAWPDKSWRRETCPRAGQVVVRVVLGGETYRIYVLDAHDEMHRICKAYEGVSGSEGD